MTLRKLILATAMLVSGFAFGQSYTTAPLADGFDYPVGKPDAAGYYVYRGFTPGGHLGRIGTEMGEGY